MSFEISNQHLGDFSSTSLQNPSAGFADGLLTPPHRGHKTLTQISSGSPPPGVCKTPLIAGDLREVAARVYIRMELGTLEKEDSIHVALEKPSSLCLVVGKEHPHLCK